MPTPPAIPYPSALPGLLRTLALLDSILVEEDYIRMYWFHPDWSEHTQLARIDNGAGDHLFVVLGPEGVVLKGFDHESPVSPWGNAAHALWPGIYEGLPEPLHEWLRDPALEHDDVTFCLWRETGDPTWRRGPVTFPRGERDGSAWLLQLLFQTPEAYLEWATDYYEEELDAPAVRDLFAGEPLTEELIERINPKIGRRHLRRLLRELSP